MAVDPVNDLVFVSTPGNGSVEVLDFSGNIVGIINGLGHNPSDAANSIIYADGFIYMTDTTNGTVDRIDPSTLSVNVLAAGFDTPLELVYSAGKLWTTTGASWPPPTLVSIDMSTGVTTSYGVPLEGAGLVSGPGLPNTIFTYDMGDSPMTINSIDVSSTPTVNVSQDEDGLDGTSEISNVNDVVISPDGSYFVPAGGAPYQFDEFNTSDLKSSGVDYPASPYPSAVAMTSANGGLFAGGLSGSYGPDVLVYSLDDPSDVLLSAQFPTTIDSTGNDVALARGVSFSPDGDLLFVVSGPLGGTNAPQFHVLDLPTSPTTPTTPTSPTTPTPPTTPTSPTTPTPTPPTIPTLPTIPTIPTRPPVPFASSTKGGYDLVGADGGVFVFNPPGVSGGFYGSLPGMGIHVNDIVGMVPTANNQGYYLVGSDGGVFAFGDAPFYGSLPGIGIHVHDVVGIIPIAGNTGYFLVGSDGGVFAFGSAKFLGSLPAVGIHVGNVVGIAATPSGGGYWVVTASGHVYNFGDAATYGSANASVTAIAASPDGMGYLLVGPDGGIFTFGDASFEGSLPGQGIHVGNIVGVVPSGDGNGYLLFGSDGGIFAFGDAPFEGSLPGINVHIRDIVGAVPTS